MLGAAGGLAVYFNLHTAFIMENGSCSVSQMPAGSTKVTYRRAWTPLETIRTSPDEVEMIPLKELELELGKSYFFTMSIVSLAPLTEEEARDAAKDCKLLAPRY